MHNNGRRSRFGVGLALYVITFLILSVIFLLFFYEWLSAYEASRPAVPVENYKLDVALNGPPEACYKAFDILDRSFTKEEDIRAFAKEVMEQAEYSRSLTESSENKTIYTIRYNSTPIGSLTLEQTGSKKFQFQSWEVTDASYDFSAFFKEDEVTVPSDYQVYCNGTLLGPSYITEKGILINTLSAYYDDFVSLPSLVTYHVGPCLGIPELLVKDRRGSTVTEEDMNEFAFLDNCTPEEISKLSGFAREYVATYVQFTANVHDSFYYYYNQLRQMTAPDSPLNDRMSQAIQSFGFTTTRSCEIVDDCVNLVMKLDASHFLVDYSYTTETVSPEGSARDTRNVRLVVGIGNNLLLVTTMTYY